MISGLNQEVELLGRTFHFQTELSDQDGLAIRTAVFVGGKVIATRETRLEEAGAGMEESIRAWMKQQHSQTITTFIDRAKRYQLRDQEGREETAGLAEMSAPLDEAPALEPPPAPPPAAPRRQGIAPPTGLVTDEVASAVRVRRLFARFRQAVDPVAGVPDDPAERLAKTARAFAEIIDSPLFSEIRIDEQARCHLLKEQIDEWLDGERDRWQAAQIWSGAVTFSDYLAEINCRAELVAYDQQILVWALEEVQNAGMSHEVLKRLKTLYGRHPMLDRLLDRPDGVAGGVWTAHLRSALTLL